MKRVAFAVLMGFALTVCGMAFGEATEIRVNTVTIKDQDDPSVAMNATGDTVVVWTSDTIGLVSKDEVRGQRFLSDGTRTNGEFSVNSYTNSYQNDPDVAIDPAGNFVVVWDSDGQDLSSGGVFGQRYAADGTPAGGEFMVNTYTNSHQVEADVAMDASGNFVVVWESRHQDGDGYGVFGQRYLANGTPAGGEFQVNTFTVSEQYHASVAMDAAGNFVVVWESDAQDGWGYGVYGQRFLANGVSNGGEFLVNVETNSNEQYASVAMDATGGFVVVWQTYVKSVGEDIRMRRYLPNGTPVGGEVTVNTYTNSDQSRPSVAMDASGNFTVAWRSKVQEGHPSYYGVYAQQFLADGTPTNGEFRVNTYTSKDQEECAVAMRSLNHFITAWKSEDQDPGGPSAGDGVYAKIYRSDYIWESAAELGGGWKWLSWFGYFNVWNEPWIYHTELGWIWCYGNSLSDLTFWAPAIGRLWTSQTSYPYFYNLTNNYWMYYVVGSTAPCWFYNFSTGLWESY